jgi:hypothetical protein
VRHEWPKFYRFAGVCALLTAATTLPIHLLSFPSETFEERIALHDNLPYLARLGLVAVHVCLVVVSMLAVALRRRTAYLPLAALGFLGYFVFAIGELLRTALAFFAVNAGWRASWANATDSFTRATMATLLAAWPGINAALFHLFLFGFVAGTACYAAILLRGRGLERATGVVFAVWAVASGEGWFAGIVPGFIELPDAVSVTLQPLGRVLIGVWLWRAAVEAAPENPVS